MFSPESLPLIQRPPDVKSPPAPALYIVIYMYKLNVHVHVVELLYSYSALLYCVAYKFARHTKQLIISANRRTNLDDIWCTSMQLQCCFYKINSVVVVRARVAQGTRFRVSPKATTVNNLLLKIQKSQGRLRRHITKTPYTLVCLRPNVSWTLSSFHWNDYVMPLAPP